MKQPVDLLSRISAREVPRVRVHEFHRVERARENRIARGSDRRLSNIVSTAIRGLFGDGAARAKSIFLMASWTNDSRSGGSKCLGDEQDGGCACITRLRSCNFHRHANVFPIKSGSTEIATRRRRRRRIEEGDYACRRVDGARTSQAGRDRRFVQIEPRAQAERLISIK